MLIEISLVKQGDYKQQLNKFVLYFFALVDTCPEYYQVSLTFWNQIEIKQAIKEIMQSFFQRFIVILEKILINGVKNKCFCSVDIKYFSYMIITSIDGMNRHAVFAGNGESNNCCRNKTTFKKMIFTCLQESQ